jgi:hypothetical protein
MIRTSWLLNQISCIEHGDWKAFEPQINTKKTVSPADHTAHSLGKTNSHMELLDLLLKLINVVNS